VVGVSLAGCSDYAGFSLGGTLPSVYILAFRRVFWIQDLLCPLRKRAQLSFASICFRAFIDSSAITFPPGEKSNTSRETHWL